MRDELKERNKMFITIEKDLVDIEGGDWAVKTHINQFEEGLAHALHYELVYSQRGY